MMIRNAPRDAAVYGVDLGKTLSRRVLLCEDHGHVQRGGGADQARRRRLHPFGPVDSGREARLKIHQDQDRPRPFHQHHRHRGLLRCGRSASCSRGPVARGAGMKLHGSRHRRERLHPGRCGDGRERPAVDHHGAPFRRRRPQHTIERERAVALSPGSPTAWFTLLDGLLHPFRIRFGPAAPLSVSMGDVWPVGDGQNPLVMGDLRVRRQSMVGPAINRPSKDAKHLNLL
jgi:hypothetical protein